MEGRVGRFLTIFVALVAAQVAAPVAPDRPTNAFAGVVNEGGYVVDAWGALHPFGGAAPMVASAYSPGQDLTRGVAVSGDGGWVLDAYGGLHPTGGAPAVQGSAYWPPFDVVRGAIPDAFGRGGWLVDMWGGVHRFGTAPDAGTAPRWAGHDLARGAVADPHTGGGWVVDAYGGLHPFAGARTVVGYWPGLDLARGGSSGSGGSGSRAVARPPRHPVRRVVTYSYAVRGAVRTNLAEFAASVDATLADQRGWARAGFGFRRVPSGGDMIVWLSQASKVPTFGAPCDSFYSCRQGRNVIINEDRFAFGSPNWPGALAHYRQMVVNHETGHWIGFGHAGCPARGAPGPVMMQQSIRLSGCAPNPWPLDSEIAAATRATGSGGPEVGTKVSDWRE